MQRNGSRNTKYTYKFRTISRNEPWPTKLILSTAILETNGLKQWAMGLTFQVKTALSFVFLVLVLVGQDRSYLGRHFLPPENIQEADANES